MPVLVLGAVALLAILAWIAFVCLQLAFNHSLGPMLDGLARMFTRFRAAVFGVVIFDLNFVARFIEALKHTIEHALGEGAQGTEWAIVKFLHYAAAAFGYLGREVGGVAHETLHALHLLRHGVIPRLIRAGVAPIHAEIRGLLRTEHWLVHHAIPTLGKDITALDHIVARLARDAGVRSGALQRELGALARGVPVAVGGAVALPGRLAVGLVHTGEQAIRGRLSRVERLIGAAALTAAVLRVLARVAPWARCSNVRRVGRHVCGMDAGLLESLLADALLVVGTLSIVELAREVQAIVEPVTDSVRAVIREAQ